jgi:hypothetical protein
MVTRLSGLVEKGVFERARWTRLATSSKPRRPRVAYFAEGGKAVRVPVRLGRGDGQFAQVRQYKRAGASDWTEFTGSGPLASPAAALSDGQRPPG